MSRTQKLVDSISGLCQKIDSLEFASPGIFTNAIITKPEVTTLIRDALAPEQSLYKITGGSHANLPGRIQKPQKENPKFSDLKPTRIDGKSIYISQSFQDWTESAVKMPKVVEPLLELDTATDESLSPRKRTTSSFRLVPRAVAESEDFNTICHTVAKVAEQYAGIEGAESVREKVATLRTEYNRLLDETQDLELQVSEQKKQLEIYNDSLNELLPRRGNILPQKRGIEELIEREEAEIRQLEAELNKRQA